MFGLFKSKKGMGLQDLYPAILSLVLVGILLGIGVVVLTQFAATTGVAGTAAATYINATSTGIGGFSTWIPLIVIIIAAAVIIGLVIRSFVGGRD